MKKNILFIIPVLFFPLLAGCDKNPLNKLREPVSASNSSAWSGTFVCYDDELKTGGGYGAITWGDNFVVDFNCRENPYNGVKCVKVTWDGNNVTAHDNAANKDITVNTYAGFSLIVPKSSSDWDIVKRDLSPGGYTKVTFWARKAFMSLNTVLRMESPNGTFTSIAPTDAYETALTDEWKQYSFDITGSLESARFFVNVVLKTDGSKGNGATIYIDDIKLTK
jgi:hypothetical protein